MKLHISVNSKVLNDIQATLDIWSGENRHSSGLPILNSMTRVMQATDQSRGIRPLKGEDAHAVIP